MACNRASRVYGMSRKVGRFTVEQSLMDRFNCMSISRFARCVSWVGQRVAGGNRGNKVKQDTDGRQQLRKVLGNLIILAVGVGLFVVVASHISFSEFVGVLTGANLVYLCVAVLGGVAATVFRTIRYGYFFPPGERWLKLYGAFALMRLVNAALPFKSGEGIALGMLKKYRLSPSIAETTPVWVLLRVTDLAALSIWFTVGLSVISIDKGLYGMVDSVRWLLLFVFILVVFVTFCLSRSISLIMFCHVSISFHIFLY